MNRAKAKGDAFERAVVDYLEPFFPDVERRKDRGRRLDRGDVIGVPGWVLECKDHQEITLSSFVDQAAQEAQNARVGRFAAIVKRRRKSVAEAYVVMPLRVFAELAYSEHDYRCPDER